MTRKKLLGGLLALAMTASVILTGCGGIDTSATAATMGETKISMGMANFMLRMQQASYDTYYRSYFGEDMWNSDQSGTGETLGQTVKKNVMDTLKEMYVLDEHKDAYGVTVTEEEMTKIKEAAKAFLEKNASAVKGVAATREEDVVEVLRLYTIRSKMTKIIEADVDTNVSDEEAAQTTVTYARFSLTTTDASGSEKALTDDEKAALKVKVKEMLVQLRSGGDFETLAKEAGGVTTSYSYGKDESSLDAKVIEAVGGLQEGGYSDLIETDKVYYVVRLDAKFDKDATEKKKETIVSDRKTKLYESVTKPWIEEKDFKIDEGVWSKATFDRVLSIVSDHGK